MGRQIITAISQYGARFMYSALLKFTITMALLPVVFISTAWFDGRFPYWFSYLLMWFSQGEEYAGIEEFVQAIFFIIFALWVIEEVVRYIANRYYHKKLLDNSQYNIKVWFIVVSLVYFVGIFAAPPLGAMVYGLLAISYALAVAPLGVCRAIDKTKNMQLRQTAQRECR